MKDSPSLSVDPSSPDDPVENRFFQQGVDQEGTPRDEQILFVEEQLRRQRKFLWIGGAATALAAIFFLVVIGRGAPESPAVASVASGPPAPGAASATALATSHAGGDSPAAGATGSSAIPSRAPVPVAALADGRG